MRLSLLRVVVVLCMIGIGLPATADVIVRSATFNSSSVSSPTTATYNLQSFDSSLGTLNQVSLMVTGVMVAQFTTVIIPIPLGGYARCAYSLHLDQGLGSMPNTYSSFSDSAYSFSGAEDCAALPVIVSSGFTYSFTFGSTSEFTGFVTGSSTGTIPNVLFNGRPSNFADVPGGILGTVQLNGTVDNANLTPTWSLQQMGSVVVTYDYTPAAPASVPEPATLVMLASGLTGVALKRRRSC